MDEELWVDIFYRHINILPVVLIMFKFNIKGNIVVKEKMKTADRKHDTNKDEHDVTTRMI